MPKSNYQTGLIKEALLISVALFLLVKAGFDIEQLLTAEFWQSFLDYVLEILRRIFEEIKEIAR